MELYSRPAIRGFLHLGIGEEACAVGVMSVLTPDDAVVATYREHGHALARGISMRAAMAELEGKVEGCSRGRGGSMHLFDAAHALLRRERHRRWGPAARRWVWPWPTTCRADTRVTACFFGDGAVAEGEFHESMNLAALWHLPVLFCCENNLYAMGTALGSARVGDRPVARRRRATACPHGKSTAWTCAPWRTRPARPPRRYERAAARTSSSCAPTGSGPIRCTTRTVTETRRRSSSGRSATQFPRQCCG